MKVPGDAVPIGQDLQFLSGGLDLGVLQGQCRLIGKGREHFELVLVESR